MSRKVWGVGGNDGTELLATSKEHAEKLALEHFDGDLNIQGPFVIYEDGEEPVTIIQWTCRIDQILGRNIDEIIVGQPQFFGYVVWDYLAGEPRVVTRKEVPGIGDTLVVARNYETKEAAERAARDKLKEMGY